MVTNIYIESSGVGLEVPQKSEDMQELSQGIFQVGLGLEKTVVGVIESVDVDVEAEKIKMHWR